jgi:hypothetical protein
MNKNFNYPSVKKNWPSKNFAEDQLFRQIDINFTFGKIPLLVNFNSVL